MEVMFTNLANKLGHHLVMNVPFKVPSLDFFLPRKIQALAQSLVLPGAEWFCCFFFWTNTMKFGTNMVNDGRIMGVYWDHYETADHGG